MAASEVRLFVVDGETFRVQLHEDGGFDCEWLSGPNPGYGFGSGAPGGYSSGAGSDAPQSATRLAAARASDDREDSIRGFLAMIDANTGFIGD